MRVNEVVEKVDVKLLYDIDWIVLLHRYQAYIYTLF